jgi:hypothetical protein
MGQDESPPRTVETATDLPALLRTPPNWTENEEAGRKGFSVHGFHGTPGRKAYFIHLEARPGKEHLVQQFLRDINAGVEKEPGTGPWFALRYSKTTFAIFEAFANYQDRTAHDLGPGGVNFKRSELLKEALAYPAQIYRVDVMHGKFHTLFGREIEVVDDKKLHEKASKL